MSGEREVQITHHGYKRAKQRCGLNVKALNNTAPKAFAEGLKVEELSGKLRRYIEGLIIQHRGVYRIYGHHVYCFSRDAVLITILELHPIHRGAAASALKKRTNPKPRDEKAT